MKKFNLFAMLLAAFTLSFSLTACSGEDGPNNPNGKDNTLTVAGNSVKFVNARAFGMENHVEIIFECDNGNQNDVQGGMMINLANVSLENGKVPTGTYSRGSYDSDKACYDHLAGSIFNEKAGKEVWFEAAEDSGNVKIERNGDNYTISMPSMKVNYQTGEESKTETISFTYKGKIELEQHGY